MGTNGSGIASNYSVNVEGGKKYYIHIGCKRGSSTYYGYVTFNSLTVSKSTSTTKGTVDGNISNCSITMNVTGTDYIEYNGERWYPYGSKVNIYYYGSGTITKRYSSSSTWSTVSSTSTTLTANAPTTYYAQITDKGGNVITEEKLKVNIIPVLAQNAGLADKVTGRIFPVKVTYSTSGNVYGTNTYRSDSNINTAATHMGLVKSGETKTVLIKTVSYPGVSIAGSTRNGVTTSAYNSSSYIGFVFLDENLKPIYLPTMGAVEATLSGYDVVSNSRTYSFINDETSVIPTNGGDLLANGTTANSYIVLDLTEYAQTDVIQVTLNALVSCYTNRDYGYATITTSTTAPAYNATDGRFIFITGSTSAQDYSTLLSGGQRYYLHLGYYKGNTKAGQNLVRFNSLNIQKLDLAKPTIELSKEPIEYNGELWYPYNTRVTIKYDENCKGCYMANAIYGGTSIGITEANASEVAINLQKSMTISAGYNGKCNQESLKVNIMPYQTYVAEQQYYYYRSK